MPGAPIDENKPSVERAGELESLIQASPIAILALDAGSKLRIWSAAAERIFGWTEAEILGRNVPFASLDPGGDFSVMVDSGLCGDQLAGIELTLGRRDGAKIEVSVSIAPLRTPGGGIHGVMALVENITERKHAEERQTRERNILLALMDNIPDLIFVKDADGRFVTSNLAHVRFLGKLNPDEVIGKDESDLLPREIAENNRVQDLEIVRTGRLSIDREELRMDSGGVARWFSTTRVPFTGPEGGVTGVIGLSRDITSRRLLETKLAQAQKLESIGHLAAGVAHEINTPIQYVSDNTAFLRESFQNLAKVLSEYQDLYRAARDGAVTESLLAGVGAAIEEADVEYVLEEVPKAIQQCSEGLARVSTIVKAMKEFSHPGPSEMRAVDLNHAITSTVEVSRSEWKYIADMRLELDPELASVRCFPDELNQVVLNLIINAAHAIADQPKSVSGKGIITISTRREGEWVEIRVEDTGTGIPEAVQPKVFLPFFTTKDVGKGTGQGLSIAHAVVVEKHRGEIRFETEDGKGTVFIVRIPIDGMHEAPR
jgi:PAS domain S-box-containing protein